MTDLQMWSLLVGFFLPLGIAVVQRPSWSEPVRAALTFLLCAVAGVGTAYFNGDLESARSVISATLLILVTTLSTFKSLWKPTGVSTSIESLTSPGRVVQGEVDVLR